MGGDTLWGLHHRGGHELVSESHILIGWVDAGDLTDLPDDREAFKARLRATYPSKNEPWVANAAGQLLRFRHVMGVGDFVVYPRKADRTLNIGRISGEYTYDPDSRPRYPHGRAMNWLKVGLTRDGFSSGCLYEVGSALSVFTVKEHKGELLATLDDAPPAPAEPVAGDTTVVGPVSEDEPDFERIAELTRDFILKTFKTELKGHDFAQFSAWLLEAMGYSTRLSPPGADQGVDIVATEDPLGVGRPLLKVQCKSGSGTTSSSDVQALNGTLAEGELGVFVALGGYSPQARQVAGGMPKMRLLGPDEILDLILDHYASLRDEAKQAVPLRRVWMPDRVSATD